MSYDNPVSVSYNFNHDFGAARTIKLKPPQGKNSGRVADLHAAATEVFTAVTTEAFIQVGDGTTADKYAGMGLGTLADNASLAATEEQLKAPFNLDADGITELTLSLVANTGGTPTGVADVAVTVEWF